MRICFSLIERGLLGISFAYCSFILIHQQDLMITNFIRTIITSMFGSILFLYRVYCIMENFGGGKFGKFNRKRKFSKLID